MAAYTTLLVRHGLKVDVRVRILLCITAVALFTFLGRAFEIDDAFIYDRYIANALHGWGLVFNPGEHYNGLSSPLYSYLLLFFSWIFQDHVRLAAVVVFGMSLAGACAIAELIFAWSGLVLASMVYMYSTIGMETPFVVFLLTLSLYLYLHEKYDWLPLALTLLALTRIEMGLLIPFVAWGCYRAKRRPSLVSVLPAAAIFIAILFTNHHFYGSYLPASSAAKLGQGRSGYWGRWPTAFLRVKTLEYDHRPALYTALFLFVFAPLSLFKLKGSRLSALAVPFAVLLFSICLLLNIPAYHWYYAPFILLLTLYAVVGLPKSRVGYAVLAALVAAQSIGTVAALRLRAAEVHNYRVVGEWLANNTAPGATLEACEIGELGWSAHRKLIDVLGLTYPKNADHITHRDITSWLGEDHPDYIVFHKLRTFPYERVAVVSKEYGSFPFMPETCTSLTAKQLHLCFRPRLRHLQAEISNLTRPEITRIE